MSNMPSFWSDVRSLSFPRGTILETNGNGLWSGCARFVEITHIDIDTSGFDNVEDGQVQYGELLVQFTRKSWNTAKHGLIYTDPQFLKELKRLLRSQGYDVRNLDYTEQGMQGDDYVSLHVDAAFLRSVERVQSVTAPKSKSSTTAKPRTSTPVPYTETMYGYMVTMRDGRDVRVGSLYKTKKSMAWGTAKRIPLKHFREGLCYRTGITESMRRSVQDAVSVRIAPITLSAK